MNNPQKTEKKVDDLSDFRKLIFTGMKNGIDNASRLLDEPVNTDYPEYLLTVAIAEELVKASNKVLLEEKTSNPFTWCFEHMTHDIHNHCFRSSHDYDSRPGKIDIIVLNDDYRTIYGIEVKRINPKKRLLKKRYRSSSIFF
jgi:hypothetical protein